MKIKVNDTVRVIAGKDKGKEGKVLRIYKKRDKVIVEGVNIRVRHLKKSGQNNGQKVEFPGAMHVSNVMVLDPKSGKPSRVGYSVGKDGKKIRIAKGSGESLDDAKGKPKAAKSAKPAAKKDAKKTEKKETTKKKTDKK